MEEVREKRHSLLSNVLSVVVTSWLRSNCSHTCSLCLVVLACDQTNAVSILIYQNNLDKIKKLTSHSAVGVSGPNCDMVNFTEYVRQALIDAPVNSLQRRIFLTL